MHHILSIIYSPPSSPLCSQDGKKDERIVDDSDDAAAANQRRMNADPLEVMLMNMGYRITGDMEGDGGDPGDDGQVHCRPS
jgi:WD and tetratricopeptide repeat-containing protein 1